MSAVEKGSWKVLTFIRDFLTQRRQGRKECGAKPRSINYLHFDHIGCNLFDTDYLH